MLASKNEKKRKETRKKQALSATNVVNLEHEATNKQLQVSNELSLNEQECKMNCGLCGSLSKEKGKGKSAPKKLVTKRCLHCFSRHSHCCATNYRLHADFPFLPSFECFPRKLNEQRSFVFRLQARCPKRFMRIYLLTTSSTMNTAF